MLEFHEKAGWVYQLRTLHCCQQRIQLEGKEMVDMVGPGSVVWAVVEWAGIRKGGG